MKQQTETLNHVNIVYIDMPVVVQCNVYNVEFIE